MEQELLQEANMLPSVLLCTVSIGGNMDRSAPTGRCGGTLRGPPISDHDLLDIDTQT